MVAILPTQPHRGSDGGFAGTSVVSDIKRWN
jgi:hypothetical protein